MNKKKIRLRIMAVLLSSMILSACSNAKIDTNNAAESKAATEASFIVTSDMITYDKEDYYSDWKNENPNYIELSGTSASVKGSGATVNGSKVTITAAGVYVISGKLSNGQIIVDVQDKGTVKLVLNGVEINSAENAPIYVKNAGKAIISLQEGTQNTIVDGEKYVLEDASSDEPNATIFSKANLVINGTGTLIVKGNYNNGITSKDDLKITGGNINIYSKDDGLMGRDMLIVKEGNIKVEAGGDGVKSTNDEDATKGYIALQGGTFDLKAGKDGIQAETSLLIEGGKFNITTGGGSAKAIQKTNNDMQRPMEKQDNTAAAKNTETETESAKAIKATSDISINGGSIIIDSSDDAVHSNNSVNIAGGDITITSGDDGLHVDLTIAVKGGKVNITKSYEGIEASVITLSDGEVHVVASDDGINVAGGNDGSAVNGRPGENNFSSSSDNKLNISGGHITVNSNGDGLDSNGSIYMTGGTVIVNGPTANGNGALDYDKAFEMSGGFLVSAGSSGMMQAPSEASKQYSIAMTFPQAQKAGNIINLQDSKGNSIVTFAPGKDYQAVVISSPELKKDSNYTLYSGGTSTGAAVNGLYSDGEYKGGTKVVDFTVANSVTWLNESGVTTAQSSLPGGMQRPGAGGSGPKTRP